MSHADLGTVIPSEVDRAMARQSKRLLESLPENARVQITAEGRTAAELPAAVLRVLLGVLKEVERGHSITVLPTQGVLTTQQAADLLRVSRPHLVKLLDAGVIPGQKTGAHRRVRVSDLLVYQARREEEQDRLLRELTEEAQEIGLDY